MGYQIPRQVQNIQLACMAAGYQFEILDKHSGYLCRITQNDKMLMLGAGFINAYPINSATAYTISLDKAFTYMALQNAGLRIPAGDYFFISYKMSGLRGQGKSVADAITFANSLGYPVIAKPINGSRGNYVQPVYNDADLRVHLSAMSKDFYAAIVQQKIEGNEYRAFVIDGVTKFVYKKKRHEIYFDSPESFRQKIVADNEYRESAGLNAIDLSSVYVKEMEARVLKNEPVRFEILNISSGQADVEELSTGIPAFISATGVKIFREMNLRVFAYDFISPAASINDIDDCVILEVNGNPMMESLGKAGRHDLITSLWLEILEKSFKTIPDEE